MSRFNKCNNVEYMGVNVGRRDVLETVNKKNVELFCRYIKYLLSDGLDNKSPSYLYDTAIAVVRFLAYIYEKLGDKNISDITKEELDEYKYFLSKECGNNYNAIVEKINVVVKFYRILFSVGKIPACEVMNCYMRKKEHKVLTNYITKEQIEKAMNTLPEHLKLYMKFSLSTAIKSNDLRELKWNQINFENCSVNLERGTYLIFNSEVSEMLLHMQRKINEDNINAYGYVFRSDFKGNNKDRPISKNTICRWCYEIGESIGIDNLRHLDFRHTAIKNMMSASGSVGMTSMIMDCPNLSSTARYFYDENMNKELLAEYKDICEI